MLSRNIGVFEEFMSEVGRSIVTLSSLTIFAFFIFTEKVYIGRKYK